MSSVRSTSNCRGPVTRKGSAEGWILIYIIDCLRQVVAFAPKVIIACLRQVVAFAPHV